MAAYAKKTQIYVSDEQWEQLHRESGLSGHSIAEVIRVAIDEHLSSQGGDTAGFESALSVTSGLWKDRRDVGETDALVRDMRSGWSRREEREFGGGVSD